MLARRRDRGSGAEVNRPRARARRCRYGHDNRYGRRRRTRLLDTAVAKLAAPASPITMPLPLWALQVDGTPDTNTAPGAARAPRGAKRRADTARRPYRRAASPR